MPAPAAAAGGRPDQVRSPQVRVRTRRPAVRLAPARTDRDPGRPGCRRQRRTGSPRPGIDVAPPRNGPGSGGCPEVIGGSPSWYCLPLLLVFQPARLLGAVCLIGRRAVTYRGCKGGLTRQRCCVEVWHDNKGEVMRQNKDRNRKRLTADQLTPGGQARRGFLGSAALATAATATAGLLATRPSVAVATG